MHDKPEPHEQDFHEDTLMMHEQHADAVNEFIDDEMTELHRLSDERKREIRESRGGKKQAELV